MESPAQIIKDEKKGVLFSKGHIVKEVDIPLLLSVGKEHLFVWEKKEGILHENEGADILYKICAGDSMHGTDVKEGKIELVADEDGVLKIRRDALLAVNSLGEMMIASRHGDFPVKKGDKLAGTRIIPLVIEKEKMDKAVEAAGPEPIFSILPYHLKKVGIVTTGSDHHLPQRIHCQKSISADFQNSVLVCFQFDLAFFHISSMHGISCTDYKG